MLLSTDLNLQVLIICQQILLQLPVWLWILVGDLGKELVVIMLLCLIFYTSLERFLISCGSFSSAIVLTYWLKNYFKYPRPIDTITANNLHFFDLSTDGFSFPSGHSTVTAAFCAVIFLNFKNRTIRIIAILFTIAIVLSRLASGNHWPLDVLAGVAIGIGITYAAYFIGSYWLKKITLWQKLIECPKVSTVCFWLFFGMGSGILAYSWQSVNWLSWTLVASVFSILYLRKILAMVKAAKSV